MQVCHRLLFLLEIAHTSYKFLPVLTNIFARANERSVYGTEILTCTQGRRHQAQAEHTLAQESPGSLVVK